MLLTIFLLSLICGLGTALLFVHKDLKKEQLKSLNYRLNYKAAWAEVTQLQHENNDMAYALEQHREEEFRKFHNEPCESEAFKAGYTLDAEGNLVLAESKLAWSTNSTNGCCDVYDDCGDACEY